MQRKRNEDIVGKLISLQKNLGSNIYCVISVDKKGKVKLESAFRKDLLKENAEDFEEIPRMLLDHNRDLSKRKSTKEINLKNYIG